VANAIFDKVVDVLVLAVGSLFFRF